MEGRRELSSEPLVIPEIISFPLEADLSSSDPSVAALAAAIRPGAGVVIADLSRTVFCDGASMRALLAAADQAVGCGVELRAVIPSPAVWRLLALLSGDRELRVYPNMKAALTGAPGTALLSGPEDPASRAPDITERYHQALRAARQVAERFAVTKDFLQQRQPNAGLLQHSEFARLYKQASTMPVIEQAKGILMFYEHCSADEAFDILRRASQRSNVPVREIAADIVERTSR